MPDMEIRILPVKLDHETLFARGQELGKKESDLAKLAEDKKAAASKFKSKIEECAAEITKLSSAVNTGYEDQEIGCSWRLDYQRKCAELFRDDTGEIVQSRPLTREELQEALFKDRDVKDRAPAKGKGKKPLEGMDDEAERDDAE